MDAEIERRELAKLEQAREGVARKTERKVVETLDALVEKRLLTAEQADEVELVLLDEFDQTWEIKADAGLGHLTGEEAYEDYLALREQTDEQLQALLGEAGLESVRRAFDGK